ncbi:MAG: monofunctional biosynthetic peptidoglycan transglycosylase [Ignavibacteriaceae bacterium]|nr:monofunctional biosynthetic peptidoglycan transglycosylase [Ignavibacteriaceae bacterium]
MYFSVPALNIPWLSYSGTRVTSLMEQRAIENFLIFYPSQAWVDIDDVNPNLLKAIISMEDGKFFTHKGIDWKELKTSLRLNKRRGRAVRGGSTISMQLSKNLFLSTNKSLVRKAKEFLITFRMEKELSKKSILEQYVNIVEWGDGVFGIKKAASKYFNKSPNELSSSESSRLAAVIPSPLRHDPSLNSRYVNRRSSIIRARLNNVELFPDKKK